MKNRNNIKKLVGIATLAALVVVLQLISNYIPFEPVSITLALIPMVIGAIMYGPVCGLGLGMLMGVIIFTAPSTELFMSFNPGFTVLLCLTKTGVAGFVVGWVYKGIIRLEFLRKTKFYVAVVASTLLAPLINTGLFIIGSAILFQGLSCVDKDGVTQVLVPSTSFGEAFTSAVGFVVVSNFLIEFAYCVVLSPSLIYLFKVLTTKFNLGYSKDFTKFAAFEEEKESQIEIDEPKELYEEE